MPVILLVPFVAVILYFFLPHHILSRSGSRVTWLIRGFVFCNGVAYWVQTDPWLSTIMNPVWQLALRFFFLETCYVLALGALYSLKGWQMPGLVGAAIFAFYGVWVVSCLALLQTPLPLFGDADATLRYTTPTWIVLRVVAATSTLILFIELTKCLYRFWKGDQMLAARLRFASLTAGTAIAFVNRLFVLAHIATVLSASNWSGLVLTIEKDINLVATVFFLAGCLPPWLMERVARAIVYLDQQRAIVELTMLRAALIHSTAPLPWPLPGWRARLNQPAYVLYSSMIDVLDRLLLLETLPSTATLLDGVEAIHDPIAPDELLERLRQMARRLWFKQWTARLRRLIVPFAVEPSAARSG